ncbi:MAG TPA: YraN family protein [Bacillota bacterium]|nr:YraN family protein [Bacillota bacterium]HPT86994.1 YraN family protein [Bacillota bacterium]
MNKTRSKKVIGDWGEKVAARYLEEKGYQIVTFNYRCSYGEVDLVCRDQEIWCFVEVKTWRSQSPFGSGYFAVSRKKQKRMTKTALDYLSRNRLGEPPVRFDIVSIEYTSTQDYRITLLKNAFF